MFVLVALSVLIAAALRVMLVLARVLGKLIVFWNVVADLSVAWTSLFSAAHQRFVFFKRD